MGVWRGRRGKGYVGVHFLFPAKCLLALTGGFIFVSVTCSWKTKFYTQLLMEISKHNKRGKKKAYVPSFEHSFKISLKNLSQWRVPYLQNLSKQHRRKLSLQCWWLWFGYERGHARSSQRGQPHIWGSRFLNAFTRGWLWPLLRLYAMETADEETVEDSV